MPFDEKLHSLVGSIKDPAEVLKLRDLQDRVGASMS